MRVVAACAFALVAMVLGAGPARAAEGAPKPGVEHIRSEVAAERFGHAAVLCEEGRAADNSSEYKAICGGAFLALGDKLWAARLTSLARKRWEEAAAWDARLVDDAAFAARLAGTWKAPASGGDVTAPDGTPNAGGPTISKPSTAEPNPPAKKPGRPADAGPRWDLGLGVGLDVGYAGLAALVVGWLADEQFLLEVAVGAVYPTIDLRFRWLGLRRCLTPVVGFGMLVPFGKSDRIGLELGAYEALYELGEAVHFDLGAAWSPVYGLNLFAGVVFMTPLDQAHADTVVLFPQLAGSVSWYF